MNTFKLGKVMTPAELLLAYKTALETIAKGSADPVKIAQEAFKALTIHDETPSCARADDDRIRGSGIVEPPTGGSPVSETAMLRQFIWNSRSCCLGIRPSPAKHHVLRCH